MPRIVTDQPSNGKPRLIYVTTNNGYIPAKTNNDIWTTLAEAPYFSVPSTGDVGVAIDPLDADRELRPGEIFFETPLGVTNTTSVTRWVELRMVLEKPSISEPAQILPIIFQLDVPPRETVFLPIQGLRLLKTLLTNTTYNLDGGLLQICAEVGDALQCLGSMTETQALDHEPDSED